MDIILFRHGIAVERQDWTGNEQDRPLTGKGIRRTRRSAKGLLSLRSTPTHLLSSPLVRARETAEILQLLVRPKVTVQICEALVPEASPNALFTLLGTMPSDSVVLCVGHEPNLSVVAATLFTGNPCAGILLKKAGACLIQIEKSVGAAKGHLEWWFTPKQLRALG